MLKNLKRIKSKVCKKEVTRVGAVQAELWNANVKVESKCADDVAKFCSSSSDGSSSKGSGKGSGKSSSANDGDSSASAVQDCLRSHLTELSPECRSAEFKELQVRRWRMEEEDGRGGWVGGWMGRAFFLFPFISFLLTDLCERRSGE
jgi:hypothetical protein